MAPPATCKAIKEPIKDEWATATRTHAFLQDVNRGTISDARFNTWLAQDYLYVRNFARLLAAMIASCPDTHVDVLVGGMAAIDLEIKWFKAKAEERSIDLATTAPQPNCAEYVEFLKSLHSQPYAVQAAVFWAMEAIYNQAWTGVGEGLADPKYSEFVDRWGNAGFAQYCVDLEAQADEALTSSPPEVLEAADAAVKRAVQLELGFWGMAYAA
ncbi:putative Seed maturation protein PM36 like protein [Monoraphidium neglectum]|uniref:Putative Seed maturation protein PM36 like protein n=1 Tax=Monoraphidium neglectum TaxID=145388 RepID=A0A0D2LLP3_9CHLO|nr:putative Seed maturation protein PM36 like protein [Monoraphidium neglectum]KIZ07289.1 putative Seed maturation protein PM36 like protein [Monoraphidium neglectum]|eukprot:XP_013906308.1 putative Seed maturation protein PM36 like protein [Monoraphidium neglectum]